MSEKRVVIVGGGVVGLCVAERLARAGRRVTVVERGAAGQWRKHAGQCRDGGAKSLRAAGCSRCGGPGAALDA
jgi:glycine/D-amino acid oxidase-like deaminating enzyme